MHLSLGANTSLLGQVIPVVVLAAVRVAEAVVAGIKLMLIETSFNHKDSVVCYAQSQASKTSSRLLKA